jgi:hypothetical protein
VYDALIAWCAADAGATVLLTWNLKHFAAIAPAGLEVHVMLPETVSRHSSMFAGFRSELRRIFVQFAQVRLAAFQIAILFRVFGREVFDRFRDLAFFYVFVNFLVDWLHTSSLPPLFATGIQPRSG